MAAYGTEPSDSPRLIRDSFRAVTGHVVAVRQLSALNSPSGRDENN